MKENLKIRVNDSNRREVIDLLGSLGKSFCWDVKTRGSEVAHIFVHPPAKDLQWGSDDRYFDNHANKEITPPELRELARPKEYLNDKFELVVTNQPEDGWFLVQEDMDIATKMEDGSILFWKTVTILVDSIVWQRNPQQDKVMKEENKGRFLHQWAYEAFGRGEDVQHTPCERDCDWTSTSIANPISIFSAREMKFRLKPKTITIGSRTINKPISVKPERGTTIYIAMLTDNDKYEEIVWNDYPEDRLYLSRNLCHPTAADAIAMTEALLELMK